jgi:uncharacterized protein YnzC (UPF0291/DUF896 family)
MDQEKINRINELYRKSKCEELNKEEREEQSRLRNEYRAEQKAQLMHALCLRSDTLQ